MMGTSVHLRRVLVLLLVMLHCWQSGCVRTRPVQPGDEDGVVSSLPPSRRGGGDAVGRGPSHSSGLSGDATPPSSRGVSRPTGEEASSTVPGRDGASPFLSPYRDAQGDSAPGVHGPGHGGVAVFSSARGTASSDIASETRRRLSRKLPSVTVKRLPPGEDELFRNPSPFTRPTVTTAAGPRPPVSDMGIFSNERRRAGGDPVVGGARVDAGGSVSAGPSAAFRASVRSRAVTGGVSSSGVGGAACPGGYGGSGRGRPVERTALPLDEAFPSQEKVFAVTEDRVDPSLAPLDRYGRVPVTAAFPPPAGSERSGAAHGTVTVPSSSSGAVFHGAEPGLHRAARPGFHVVAAGDTLWGIARRYGISVDALVAANPGVNDANVISVGMRLKLPGRSGGQGRSREGAVKTSAGVEAAVHGRSPSRRSFTQGHRGGGSSKVRTRSAHTAAGIGHRPVASGRARPSASADRPSGKPGILVHVLQPGDTLWSVAERYDTSVTRLMLLNSLGEASTLKAGSEILVPAPSGGGTGTGAGSRSSGTRSTAAAGRGPGRPERGTSVVPETDSDYYVVRKGDSLWSVSRRFSVAMRDLLEWNKAEDLSTLPVGTKLRVRAPGGTRTAATGTASKLAGGNSRKGGRRSAPAVASAHGAASVHGGGRRKPRRQLSPAGISFAWPVKGEISRTFGWYEGRPHTGLDIRARLGAPVRAAASGRLTFADRLRGYGKVVIINHENGYFTVYGNLLSTFVSPDSARRHDRVSKGAVIGRVGATVEGPLPHLHFEIRKKNKAINPLRFLAR